MLPFAGVESLEGRRLLAASLINGVLTVPGLNGAETVIIRPDATRHLAYVSINGRVQNFALAAIKGISIHGGAGNSYIYIADPGGAIHAHATVVGGAGNDTIIGGHYGDTLIGGPGNDQIYGGPGRNLIEGGGGNDYLRGGPTDDQIYGDGGNCTIIGGGGDDTMGGDGADRLWFKGQAKPAPEPGNNIFIAGSGSNWILDGQNSDTLKMGPEGRDTVSSQSGDDIIDVRGAGSVIHGRKPGDVVPTNDYHAPATDFAVHIHALLRIYINDNGVVRWVNLPAGIGDFHQAPVFHKHDDTDTLHMHDIVMRDFTLGEFFQNWGISLDYTHIGRYRVDAAHPLTMTVNGRRVFDFENYVIHDHDRITIRYATTQGADPQYPPGTITGDAATPTAAAPASALPAAQQPAPAATMPAAFNPLFGSDPGSSPLSGA